MKFYYITLPNSDVEKAEQLSQALLVKHKQSIWTNWFSINRHAHWEDRLEKETEIRLFLYTQAGKRKQIDEVICEEIGKQSYSVTEMPSELANKSFHEWLDNTMSKNTAVMRCNS